MKKPYDTTPAEMNTAEEPGLAYAYTTAGASAPLSDRIPCTVSAPTETLPEGIDQTTPFVITKSGQKWWNIDVETAEELEKRITNIENGTSKLIPWEEIKRERKERVKELKLQLHESV